MLEILYKCGHCTQEERAVRVPFRDGAQDVVEWMEEVVAPAIARDHRERSPLCMAAVMEYVKIPAPENAPHVGGRPVAH